MTLAQSQSGAALATFTVAPNAPSTTVNGVSDRFFRCTAWLSVGENASRSLNKGMRVFVVGKLI